jgi:hypothetical protein
MHLFDSALSRTKRIFRSQSKMQTQLEEA